MSKTFPPVPCSAERLGHQPRPTHVGIHDILPVRKILLVNESSLVEPGCHDEEVDRSERVHTLLDNSLGVLDAIGASIDGLRDPTGLGDPTRDVGKRLGAAGGKGELRAHRPKGLGDASPQRSRGARDDSTLAFDGESIEWVWYGVVCCCFRGHSAFFHPA
jgi:hypothetical protein